MIKIIFLNNYFLYFKFFFLNNDIYIINNYLYINFIKFFKFYKYFFVIKNFFLYTFNNINKFFLNFLNKVFINLFVKILYINLGFVYFRYFMKIGLGFRKKYLVSRNLFLMYVGLRHWVAIRPKTNFFFNIERKNVLILTQFKQNLIYYSSLIKITRKESLFKTKGIMFRRSIIKRKRPRSILFARRIKYSKIKLKLSKKQKLV